MVISAGSRRTTADVITDVAALITVSRLPIYARPEVASAFRWMKTFNGCESPGPVSPRYATSNGSVRALWTIRLPQYGLQTAVVEVAAHLPQRRSQRR